MDPVLRKTLHVLIGVPLGLLALLLMIFMLSEFVKDLMYVVAGGELAWGNPARLGAQTGGIVIGPVLIWLFWRLLRYSWRLVFRPVGAEQEANSADDLQSD